jgi:hypothetical protein
MFIIRDRSHSSHRTTQVEMKREARVDVVKALPQALEPPGNIDRLGGVGKLGVVSTVNVGLFEGVGFIFVEDEAGDVVVRRGDAARGRDRFTPVTNTLLNHVCSRVWHSARNGWGFRRGRRKACL